MKSMLVVAALAALGGAMPDNIVSLRQWGASRLMGRQEAVDPLAGEQEKSETPKYDIATTNGCYKSPGDMKKQPRVPHTSESGCGEDTCGAAGFLAAGTMGGFDCYCGNTYPPEEDLVDDEKCNIPCSGYGQNACKFLRAWAPREQDTNPTNRRRHWLLDRLQHWRRANRRARKTQAEDVDLDY